MSADLWSLNGPKRRSVFSLIVVNCISKFNLIGNENEMQISVLSSIIILVLGVKD